MCTAPDGALHEHEAGEVVQPLVRHRCKQEGDQSVQSPGGAGLQRLGREVKEAVSALERGAAEGLEKGYEGVQWFGAGGCEGFAGGFG